MGDNGLRPADGVGAGRRTVLRGQAFLVTAARSIVPNGVILTFSTFSDQPAMALPYHIGMLGKSMAN